MKPKRARLQRSRNRMREGSRSSGADAAARCRSDAAPIDYAHRRGLLRPEEDAVLDADSKRYNESLTPADRQICEVLAGEIERGLPEAENKLWHAHPVWFLEGNPIVGYSKLKDCVRLLFWSGQSFATPGLAKEGKFKAAEARYTSAGQIDTVRLREWLWEARAIQWDYKNIVKRKGRLERLK